MAALCSCDLRMAWQCELQLLFVAFANPATNKDITKNSIFISISFPSGLINAALQRTQLSLRQTIKLTLVTFNKLFLLLFFGIVKDWA